MNNLSGLNGIQFQRFFIIVITITLVFVLVGCSSNSNNPLSHIEDIIVPGLPENPMPFNDLSAVELTARINIGWNLGNTLDTIGNTPIGFSWLGDGFYANTSVLQMETAWGNPVTTRANITAIKNAGFDTIRIPVSWSKAVDSNFIIRTDWMARVVEVVNYAVDNDMYIILNTHHDEDIFKFTNAEVDKSLEAFRIIWHQIARTFRNYDEKLIFEGLNEPRTKGAPHEWTGGDFIEHINLNKYYQVFVDTVRAAGGNNDRRILMVNPYAASVARSAMSALAIPRDTVPGKIVVSVHSYAPYNFALNTNHIYNTWDRNNPNDITPITSGIDLAYEIFVSKGIPVIMGEFGAMNKDNESVRADWAEFYIRYSREKGIPCVWWDNGGFTGDGELFGLLDRRTNTFAFPEVVAGLMQGLID
jgi:endoglucanase